MNLDLQRIVGKPEWEFVVACCRAIGTALGVLAYITVFAPFTTVIFEGRALRYKVQGYMLSIIQVPLALVFERAFVLEVVNAEAVDSAENVIVLCNHQGLLDYMTMQYWSNSVGVDQSCFFYVWKHCVRLPSLRTLWAEWRKDANWRVPNQSLGVTLEPILETPFRGRGGKWMVIFPEVIPWSVPDMLQHRTECNKNGNKPLRHLLYPRFSAFVQAANFFRDWPLDAVYDITITYLNTRDHNRVSIPTWFEVLLSNKDWKIRIQVSRVPMSSLPKTDRRLERWLEKLWYQKDAQLGEYLMALSHNESVKACGSK